MQPNLMTVTIPNLSPAQVQAIANVLTADVTPAADAATPGPLAALATGVKTKRTRKAKTTPAKTVSKDEDEDFGTEELDEEELETADETEESDDAEESDEDDSEDEEDEGLSFDDVRAVMNKYGNKNPEGMKAILASFNVKNTKELEKNPKKWEPVYRKVMAKIKAAKKKV